MTAQDTTTTKSVGILNHGNNSTATAAAATGTIVKLEGLVWKRRSGLGQISETVGTGKSWEQRRLVLLVHNSTKVRCNMLCYYEDHDTTSNSTHTTNRNNITTTQYDHPRGSIDLIAERATVNATPLDQDSITKQPTPYSLAIKTSVLYHDDTLKWKLCFPDRPTQLLWLVALSDVIVDAAIRDINTRTMTSALAGAGAAATAAVAAMAFAGGGATADAESNKGGDNFHRLYDEGEQGIFEVVKDTLLVNSTISSEKNRKVKEPQNGQQQQSTEVVDKPKNATIDTKPENIVSTTTTITNNDSAAVVVVAPSSSRPIVTASSSLLSSPYSLTGVVQFFYCCAVAVVNISNLYIYYATLSTTTTSFNQLTTTTTTVSTFPYDKPTTASAKKITCWQILIVANIVLFICFRMSLPSSTTSSDAATTISSTTIKNNNSNSVKEGINDNVTTKNNSHIATKIVPPAVVADQDSSNNISNQNQDHKHKHKHKRWAMSDPTVDLSGTWKLIVDDTFKKQYDGYLSKLGFGWTIRSVACSVIGRTEEHIYQTDDGRSLQIKGINPKGTWDRSLIASGYPDFDTIPSNASALAAVSTSTSNYERQHKKIRIKTAESDDVVAEAWWEQKGTVHRSWLKGGMKYGGGDHESRRYLTDNGATLVCESIFHGATTTAEVTWRYTRHVAG